MFKKKKDIKTKPVKGAKTKPVKGEETKGAKQVGLSRGFIQEVAHRIALFVGFSWGAESSPADNNRNPGMLRDDGDDKPEGALVADSKGLWIFDTVDLGWKALHAKVKTDLVDRRLTPREFAAHWRRKEDPERVTRNLFQLFRDVDGKALDLDKPLPDGL